jgi:hypothetical protein
VRVGRAPIDETAIRLLEQHNPDVQFDWTRILKAPPAAEGPARRDRDARDRDQRGRREPRREQRPRSAPQEPRAPQPPQPVSTDRPPVPEPAAAEPSRVPSPEQLVAEHLDAEPAFDVPETPDLDPAPDADFAEPFPVDPATVEDADLLLIDPSGAETAPVVVEPISLNAEALEALDVGSASYQRLGAEGVVRLRARYAEVMARIAERPLEEDAREELKLQAERLNPDAWVTADEVTAALEQYETVFEGLRGVVGRHPRRRRRSRR